jgi:hypothetical protein
LKTAHSSPQPASNERSYRDFGLLLLLAAAGVLYRPALALALLFGLWRLIARLLRPENLYRMRYRLERLPRERVRRWLVIAGITGSAVLLAWLIVGAG